MKTLGNQPNPRSLALLLLVFITANSSFAQQTAKQIDGLMKKYYDFITIQPRLKRPNSRSIPLAPLEIRDGVFRELIRISPASNYREELVTGPSGLLSRGLLEQHTANYGALPPTNQQRIILAGILNDYVCANFPEHAESHSGAGVSGTYLSLILQQ